MSRSLFAAFLGLATLLLAGSLSCSGDTAAMYFGAEDLLAPEGDTEGEEFFSYTRTK